MLNLLTPVITDETKETLYRVLIERSMIHNNDVHIICVPQGGLPIVREKSKDGWGMGVVLERPIYQEEIDAGLDTSYTGDAFQAQDQEKIPVVTKQIDSLYRLKKYLDFSRDIAAKGGPAFDLQDSITYYVATHYYDCMSGGIDMWDLIILKTVLLHKGYDGTAQVYPRGDGWSTLDDFLEEVKDVGTLEIPTNQMLAVLDLV